MWNLENINLYDPCSEIDSPRSLRALAMEGIDMEELRYTPPSDFELPHVSAEVARLRHDFCEAYRGDSLTIACKTRQRIRAEDESQQQEQGVPSSRPSSRPTSSSKARRPVSPAGSSSPTGSHKLFLPSMLSSSVVEQPFAPGRTAAQHKSSKPPSPTAAACSSPSHALRITAVGDLWGGELERQPYLLTHAFFEEVKLRLSSPEKSAHSQELPRSVSMPNCSASARGLGIGLDASDSDADELAAKEPPHVAAGQITRLAGVLKAIPRESRREQVGGLVLQTESVAVRQRRKDSLRLQDTHCQARASVEAQIQIAEAQKCLADRHHRDVEQLQDHREAVFKESRGPWSTSLQETNSSRAACRDLYWKQRRQAVHQAQLDAELTRNERLEAQANAALGRQRRVAELRDLRKIHFAKTWLDRRIRWATTESQLANAKDSWQITVLAKHSDAEARHYERTLHLKEMAELKQEFKRVKKMFHQMVAGREANRILYLRKAVRSELLRLAASCDKEDTGVTSGSCSCPSSPSSRMLKTKVPRFDFGRFAADTFELSPWTTPLARQVGMRQSASTPNLAVILAGTKDDDNDREFHTRERSPKG